jgi:putative membrane protein
VKRLKDYILIFAKGVCMGTTEVAHGVSASTMALLLGVYIDLISALRSINRETYALLRRGYFSEFWTKINGTFLLLLFGGMATGLLTVAQILAFFLRNYFIPTSALFFGLILIAGVLLLRRVIRWSYRPVFSFIFGFTFNYLLTIFAPVQTPDNVLFALFSGAFAGICLGLPGISSAFILIMIGKYNYVITGFTQLNLLIISLFFAGGVGGLWVASRFMYRILADLHSTTVALLAGLTLGALNKLWPWRVVMEYVTNGKGEQIPSFDQSILPWKYMTLTGKDPQVLLAILMAAAGVLIVVSIEKIVAGLKTKI